MERARAFDEVTVIIEGVARRKIPRRVVRTVSDYWHGIVRTANTHDSSAAQDWMAIRKNPGRLSWSNRTVWGCVPGMCLGGLGKRAG